MEVFRISPKLTRAMVYAASIEGARSAQGRLEMRFSRARGEERGLAGQAEPQLHDTPDGESRSKFGRRTHQPKVAPSDALRPGAGAAPQRAFRMVSPPLTE